MRPLTEKELETVLRKLADYTNSSLSSLLTPTNTNYPTSTSTHTSSPKTSNSKPSKPSAGSSSDRNVFRIHQSRIYYLPLSLANLATTVARSNLLSLGTCVGKMTKTGKFRAHITSLPLLTPHARSKIWIKPNGELPFLYGGNIVKAHVGRWSEGCSGGQGVIICAMDDRPLGFGVTAVGTAEARKKEPTGVVVFRQADLGEYLRGEDGLFVGT